MLLLLREWKLALAGLFLIAAAACAGWARIQTARLESAQAALATCETSSAGWQQASGERDGVIAALRAAGDRREAAITEWQARGADLEARLRALEAQLSRVRAETAQRLAAQPPLPADCDAAVREAARRAVAAERGGA